VHAGVIEHFLNKRYGGKNFEIIRPLAKLYSDKISYDETGERNMNTNTNNGNTADEIWAILKNVARRQKELARRQKETDRQMK